MKKNVSHTPGPWEYDHSDGGLHNYILIGKGCRDSEGGFEIDPICSIELPTSNVDTDHDGVLAQAKANARLIAEAPALLTWLESAVKYAERYDVSEGCKPAWLDDAKATIARVFDSNQPRA